ncbi:hypothetical protein FOCC_FOCC014838 [Frankliniella occidentalis]|nr:hypothetical protein FOCC_FOCC014838 [Frankliniella occidentalis]
MVRKKCLFEYGSGVTYNRVFNLTQPGSKKEQEFLLNSFLPCSDWLTPTKSMNCPQGRSTPSVGSENFVDIVQ